MIAPYLGDEIELRKGFYGDESLVGAFNPTLDDFDRLKRTPYGLAPAWTAFYVFAKGKSGRHYFPIRHLNGGRATLGLKMSSVHGWGKAIDQSNERPSYIGGVSDQIVDGRWRVSSVGSSTHVWSGVGAAPVGWRFELEPGRGATWVEDGFLEMEFAWRGPAPQLYQPDPIYDAFMLTPIFKVRGRILDDEVEGLGMVEMCWGNGKASSPEMPMVTRAFDQWILNLIDYEDGGTEHSVVHSTHDGRAGGGVVIRDGRLIRLPHVQSKVELTKDLQLQQCVRWGTNDLQWEAELTSGSLAYPNAPDWYWQCGKSRPLDSNRKVAWSFCFCECVPQAMHKARAKA